VPKLRTANLLGALACEISERLGEQLKSHPNQTDSSAAALNVIGFYEGCSNVALSRALKLSHTATVRLVDKLEAAGLVKSKTGEDRRSVALSLTDAGRAHVKTMLKDRCVSLGHLVDKLSAKQQIQLESIMEILLRALTISTEEADYICRLCDEIACPQGTCPVHQEALTLAEVS
jgi:MarR family transcriptional repressor of emrRAB